MSNNLKKSIATGVLAIMTATMVVPGVAMAKQNEKSHGKEKTEKHQKLKDVEKHWANKDVTEFCREQIVTGYQDGTFKPEKEVTRLEAVVMAVRALGLTKEANEHMSERLAFRDASAIPSWARGYVAVALEEGLITSTNVFQPNKPTTRMDATILLVRALDNLSDLETVNAQLKFVDTLNLSTEFKQYISQAVMNNLITGYADKTFRPNRKVTRAEMVTLFARLLENNPIEATETRVSGVLTEIDVNDSEIRVRTNLSDPVYGGTRLLKVLLSADIYRNNVKVHLEDLKAQDKVDILLDEHNQVIFIDANSTVVDELQNLLRGRIASVDSHDKTITINVNNVNRQLEVLSSATIYRNEIKVNLEALQVQDRVNILINEHNQVILIYASITVDELQDVLRGRVTSIDTHDRDITINSNNVIRQLGILSNAAIYRNEAIANLADLRAEDKVDILLNEHNQVILIYANPIAEDPLLKVMRGRIISVDTHDETVTINLSNIIEVKVALADNVVIIRDGVTVSLSRLEVNDTVELLQGNNGLITKITATDN